MNETYWCRNCRIRAAAEGDELLPAGWWSLRRQTREGMKNRGAFCSLRCLASNVVTELARRAARRPA